MEWIKRGHVPEIFSTLCVIVTLAWGAFLMFTPGSFDTPTYHWNFWLASPLTWGLVMIIGGSMFALIIVTDRRSAQWPAAMLVLLFTVWGCASWASVPAGGVPPLLSTLLALMYSVLGLLYYTESHLR
jgi:hypothetical protein